MHPTDSDQQEKPHYDNDLHNHILANVPSAEYLGATVTEDLRWDTHIQNICVKANQTIGVMRKNMNISAASIRHQAYFRLVHLLLEYTSTVWNPYNHRRQTKQFCLLDADCLVVGESQSSSRRSAKNTL